LVLNKIIIALDCSASAEQVINALGCLQINPQTQILLFHVLPTPKPNPSLELDVPHESWESLYQSREDILKLYQSQISGSQIEIVIGDTSTEIIRLANIHQADLIVLGTRGLQGVDRIIADSVSSEVVAEAPCSVLIVKTH
jgi:nucleotide-binding universal stress UspA family protein